MFGRRYHDILAEHGGDFIANATGGGFDYEKCPDAKLPMLEWLRKVNKEYKEKADGSIRVLE